MPVGSDSDREELEEVIASEDCPRAIRSRIASAMCHLDTKPVPELGDSVKDSVGAIEEVCNLLIDRAPGSNSGLSPDQLACLTEMQRGAEAFLKLHQCSRVARKVSHPLLDQPDVTLDDARTFFTSCVSFINHLLKRTREMEITMSAFA